MTKRNIKLLLFTVLLGLFVFPFVSVEARFSCVIDGTHINFDGNEIYVSERIKVNGTEVTKKIMVVYDGTVPTSAEECPSSAQLKIIASSAGNQYIVTNVKAGRKVSCGNVTGIPKKIPQLTSFAFNFMMVLVPVILIIIGSLDLFKGITAQKEDEIKKGQQTFIKRLITAAIVFFVVVIVKLLISFVDELNTNNIVSCIDCFVSGPDNCSYEG